MGAPHGRVEPWRGWNGVCSRKGNQLSGGACAPDGNRRHSADCEDEPRTGMGPTRDSGDGANGHCAGHRHCIPTVPSICSALARCGRLHGARRDDRLVTFIACHCIADDLAVLDLVEDFEVLRLQAEKISRMPSLKACAGSLCA